MSNLRSDDVSSIIANPKLAPKADYFCALYFGYHAQAITTINGAAFVRGTPNLLNFHSRPAIHNSGALEQEMAGSPMLMNSP